MNQEKRWAAQILAYMGSDDSFEDEGEIDA